MQVDGAGNVFTSTSRSDDALLEVMGAANTTGFTISSKSYGYYLRLDPEEGRLTAIDATDGMVYRKAQENTGDIGTEDSWQVEDVDGIGHGNLESGIFGRSRHQRRLQISAKKATPAPTPLYEEVIGPSVFTSTKSFG